MYNIAHDKEALMYEGVRINNEMLCDDNVNKDEIFHTLYTVIKWIGWFQEEIGNNIYDKDTSYKIIDRLKEHFFTELDA